MKHDLFFKRTIIVASLMLIPLLLPVASSAADPEDRMKDFYEAQEQGLAQIADGSVLDTLKACLVRIPSDASAGQRLLAEQNCQQVEVERDGTPLTF